MGGVDLHGFGAYSLYFKEALEKLKINYHVFRVGTYKSAIEPIIRDSMSPEAREQNAGWLASLWDSYTADIAKDRSITRETIDSTPTRQHSPEGNGRRYGPARLEKRSGRQDLDQVPGRGLS